MSKKSKCIFMFLLALFLQCTLAGQCEQSLNAREFVPQAVWTSAETTAGHDASLMIDGSIATFAQILDDTRTGKNEKTLPSKGSTPVTALIVFDLGPGRGGFAGYGRRGGNRKPDFGVCLYAGAAPASRR